MTNELELEPGVRTAENEFPFAELWSSSSLHGDEYFERSRLVLKVRTRQWAKGLPEGSSCRPSIDRCDLDSICTDNLKCEALSEPVDEEEEEGEHISPSKIRKRLEDVIRDVEKWTLDLKEGNSCYVDGERCNLGLDCIDGICQNPLNNESITADDQYGRREKLY